MFQHILAQNKEWLVVSSNINFKIKNAGIYVSGVFSGLQAHIQFDSSKSFDNKIEASISVNTLSTGNSMRDKHLKKEDYFFTEKHPTISLVSTALSKQASGTYKGFFMLSIKDTHRLIPILFSFYERDKKAVFSSHFTLNRLDYGIGSSSLILSNEVSVWVELNCIPK
ncbi:MAG: YceI family protein [Bacteroidetes bacterium]|nr:YceI family protein [Bacteroidota bacterium]